MAYSPKQAVRYTWVA